MLLRSFRSFVLFFAAGLVIASSFSASAQITTGQINGIITDPSQASVANATIMAVQVGTGHATTVTSNSNGLYVIPSLQIGEYRITATQHGFATSIAVVKLNVDENFRLDIALKLGERNEEVTVVSSLEPLERTTASVSGTFQTAQISELPINGRDYGRFSLLTPGTVITTNHIADITFNGTPDTANQFTIDGIDATSVDGAYMANGSERGARLLTGSLDTIAEFKTLSSTYTADYGRASGGVVNIVTKSGDNTLHGGVYNFLRNDYLDAKNYFQTPGTSAPKRFNDFGGNLSGPVIRKRMFFFANYEGTRQSIGLVGAGTVLSPAKRASLEATVPALDPIIEAMPSPTSTSAYIHSVVLSPTSDPNVDTINFGATNHVAENVGSLRLDNTWSDKDSSFVRFNTNYALVNGPMMTVTPTAFGLADHQLVTTDITNVAVSETHIFSPTFLNNFIGGLQQYVTSFDEAQSLPTVTIGGLTFAPGNRGLYGREPKDVQLGDSVTLVKGRHTLKAGVNMWNVYYPFHGYISAPSVSFASLTAFYANKVQSASISATFPNNTTKMIEVGSFITDSWQLRPNVALNLGLRWDWNQVPHDLTSASVWSLATNSLTSPGSPYYNSYYKNFAPRVGVAWSPTSGVVLRVGYGIYIEAFQIGNYYNKISNTTPGSTTLSSANIPTLSFPVTPFLNSATTALPSLTGYEATPRNPLNNQWSLSLGMQASSKTTISLAYVGNRAVHLLVSEGVNYVSPVTGVRPYPSYTSITASTWGTSSNYNGFQAELKESITEGLTGTAEFTYSHALGTRRLHSNPSTLQTTTDHPGTTSVKTCHSTCCISCHSVEVRDFCLVRRMQPKESSEAGVSRAWEFSILAWRTPFT